jgi:uncharacterized protein (DUF2236 family)
MRGMLSGGTLVVTDASRSLARAVLFPPRWWVLWPIFRALQVLTLGSLPPAIREAYGFEWRAKDERSFARWTTALRTTTRLLPRFAREWPIAGRARHNFTAAFNPQPPVFTERARTSIR